MEPFRTDGHLTDETLAALARGRELDELTRLEAAEHLAFCDACLQRYTDLLATAPLLVPAHSCRESLWVRVRRRTLRLVTSRYATAAAAVALALTVLWGSAPADAFLLGLDLADGERMALLCRRRHSLVGWGLVVLGVCILYTTVADWVVDFLGQFFDSWWLYNILLRDVPRLAVTIGIIALGVWFIRGPKAPPADDIPAFTPPPADKEDGHGEL